MRGFLQVLFGQGNVVSLVWLGVTFRGPFASAVPECFCLLDVWFSQGFETPECADYFHPWCPYVTAVLL